MKKELNIRLGKQHEYLYNVAKDTEGQVTPIAKANVKEEDEIQNKLQLLKNISEVKSRIRRDINSDFILAKVGEKEREAIIELTGNAYYFKRLSEVISKNARKWEWKTDVNGKHMWAKRKLNSPEKMLIKESANATFDICMNKIYMIVIMNRNVDANHLINKLSSYVEEEDFKKEEARAEALSKIGNVLKPNT